MTRVFRESGAKISNSAPFSNNKNVCVIKHSFVRQREVASVCLITTKFLPYTSSRRVCALASVRSPKVSFLDIWRSKHPGNTCFPKLKLHSASPLRAALVFISKPTLKLSSGSPLAASVSRCLAWLCVWGTALCVRVNPQAGVQPIAFSHH